VRPSLQTVHVVQPHVTPSTAKHATQSLNSSPRYSCTVYYKQTSHAIAAIALISCACDLALLLLLHPQSPLRSHHHAAVLHALFVARTLASSCIISPAIACVAKLSAPYALPMSFAVMTLGEVVVHVMHTSGASCGFVWAALERSVWVGVGAAAAEVLLSCCLMVLERQMAVDVHVRLRSYTMQLRGQQVSDCHDIYVKTRNRCYS
jgi:hypothetical protein